MDGIPEGDYRLTVSARSYRRYSSEPLHHPGDGELEVVDKAGTRSSPSPTGR